MIEKIKYKNEEYAYSVIKYLTPYLVKFGVRNNINFWASGILTIEGQHVFGLINMLENILMKLIDEFYEEPSHKHKSKYPGRYERILINDQKYTVNLVLDPMGRIAYGLFTLIVWLGKINQNGTN